MVCTRALPGGKGHTICSPSSTTLAHVHVPKSSSSSSSFVTFNLVGVLAEVAHIPAYSPHFSHQSITSIVLIIISHPPMSYWSFPSSSHFPLFSHPFCWNKLRISIDIVHYSHSLTLCFQSGPYVTTLCHVSYHPWPDIAHLKFIFLYESETTYKQSARTGRALSHFKEGII